MPTAEEPADPGDPTRPVTGRRLRILLPVLAGLAAGVVTFGLAVNRPATYRASSQLEIDQPAQLVTGGSEVVVKLSRLRLKYAPLVVADSVLKPAAASIDTTADAIRSQVSTTVPADTLTLSVNASSHDRDETVRVANAVAESLARYADTEQAGFGVPSAQRFVLDAVNPARSARKVEPATSSSAELGVVVGLIVAALSASLAAIVLAAIDQRTSTR